MPRKIDPEILSGFIAEARGYLPQIRQGIEALEQDSSRLEVLEEIHRLCHSIKGAASMVGLSVLGHLAYYLEESIEQIGAGQLPMNDTTSLALLGGLDVIERYLIGCGRSDFDAGMLAAELVAIFRRLRGQPESGDQEEVARLLPEHVEEPVPGADDLPLPDGSPLVLEALRAQEGAAVPAIEELIDEDVSPELLEAFVQEAHDHLQSINGGLRELEKTPSDRSPMQKVRRLVHTLKGAASMVGLARLSNLTHRMEDLLDTLYEGSAALTQEVLDILFATSDLLSDIVDSEEPSRFSAALLAPIYERYASLLGAMPRSEQTPLSPLGDEPKIDLSKVEGPEVEESDERPVRPRRPSQVVRVPIERLDELVRMVSELVVSRSTFERNFGELNRQAGELDLASDRLRGIAGRLESEYEVLALSEVGRSAAPAAGFGARTAASTGIDDGGAAATAVAEATAAVAEAPDLHFDDLELDRYTEFHVLSRALAETTSDVSAMRGQLSGTIGDFDAYLNRMGRLTSETQDKLMRLRMVPVASLASRLHRAVRVTARKQGKEVDLVVEGENIELDKTVLEEIADPLMHILRNAVDHGIEPPSLRQVRGKPARGKIVLRAYYEGTNVVVRVADDGAGLDLERLRTSAVENGYASEAEAENLSEGQLQSLIFMPGFTTASQISEISGRGVGLDVVKEHVTRMKGVLRIQSTAGEGMTFTIQLPMTLAITRVLLVRVQGSTYAIPLAGVTQILRLERDSIERLGDEPVLRLDDRVYPVTHLERAMGLPAGAGEEVGSRQPVLIISIGEREHALVVDRIVEAREVVVKTLGQLLVRVHGVTGATLLGDGSVVLILNPSDLFEEQTSQEVTPSAAVSVPVEHRRQVLDVMIVDDSVSVRRVLSNLVKSSGWNPITARDGLEALEMIQSAASTPDVILLDIEMPRMDGYELTSVLRARDAWKEIPIIMVTSRAGQKHRDRAFELGATEYLVKPYRDETLLAVIRRLVREARDSEES